MKIMLWTPPILIRQHWIFSKLTGSTQMETRWEDFSTQRRKPTFSNAGFAENSQSIKLMKNTALIRAVIPIYQILRSSLLSPETCQPTVLSTLVNSWANIKKLRKRRLRSEVRNLREGKFQVLRQSDLIRFTSSYARRKKNTDFCLLLILQVKLELLWSTRHANSSISTESIKSTLSRKSKLLKMRKKLWEDST